MSHLTLFGRHPFAALSLLLLALLLCVLLYYHQLLSDLLRYQIWRWREDPHVVSGHVSHEGAELYYEVHGEGEPLLLLHGGLTSSSIFFAQLPALAQGHRVITVDLRGQGRSTLGDADFSYPLLAADVEAVLDTLGVQDATVIGWSDGGIVSLLLALRHPQRVRRQLIMGSNFHPEGLTEATRQAIRENNPADESLLARLLYVLYSPHPWRWHQLRQHLQQMWLNGPRLTPEQLGRIPQDTLVVVGEFDNITLSHTHQLTCALPHARLLVIPGAGHNLLVERAARMRDLLLGFVSGNWQDSQHCPLDSQE